MSRFFSIHFTSGLKNMVRYTKVSLYSGSLCRGSTVLKTLAKIFHQIDLIQNCFADRNQ